MREDCLINCPLYQGGLIPALFRNDRSASQSDTRNPVDPRLFMLFHNFDAPEARSVLAGEHAMT